MLRKHKIKWKVIPSILKDHLLSEVILSRNMWINLPTIQLSMEVDNLDANVNTPEDNLENALQLHQLMDYFDSIQISYFAVADIHYVIT